MSKKINTTLAIAVIIIVAGIMSGVIWFGEKKSNVEINQFATQAGKKNAPTNTTTTTPVDNQAIDSIKICDGISQITDSRDANNPTYNTVAIGNQCWLERNLNVGRMIKGVSNQKNNKVIEKYCNSDEEKNCDKYGGLYQWGEAMQYGIVESSKGLCPIGWHIPSDGDWHALEVFLVDPGQSCDKDRQNVEGFGCAGAGTKMRMGGPGNFNLVVGGYRYNEGEFYPVEAMTQFWTSTRVFGLGAWGRYLLVDEPASVGSSYNNDITMVGRHGYLKSPGFSIRCIKDKK